MAEQMDVATHQAVASMPSSLNREIPLTDNALTVLRKRYLLRGLDGRPLPEDRAFKVGVSSYVASSYIFDHKDPGRALGSTSADALIRFLENRPDFSLYRDVQRAFQDPPASGGRY